MADESLPKRSSLSFTPAALSLWATLRQPLRVDSKFYDLSRCPRSSADQEPNGRCLDKRRVGHDAVFNSGDGDRWSLRKVVHLVFQGPGWGAIAPMLANRCRTGTPTSLPQLPHFSVSLPIGSLDVIVNTCTERCC
jgi:hypothetical protein